MEKCKLCDRDAILKISHCIPNSVFKRVKEGGKAVELNKDQLSANLTQDSWAEKQLCCICENKFSIFEKYSLEQLRKAIKKRKNNTHVTLRDVDQKKLAIFILSIMWRASISTHSAYKDIKLSKGLEQNFRDYLMFRNNEVFNRTSIRIQLILDQSRFAWSDEAIRNLIVSPAFNVTDSKLVFNVIFEGYYFQVFLPEMSKLEENNRGFLKRRKVNLNCPVVDFYDIKALQFFVDDTLPNITKKDGFPKF